MYIFQCILLSFYSVVSGKSKNITEVTKIQGEDIAEVGHILLRPLLRKYYGILRNITVRNISYLLENQGNLGNENLHFTPNAMQVKQCNQGSDSVGGVTSKPQKCLPPF